MDRFFQLSLVFVVLSFNTAFGYDEELSRKALEKKYGKETIDRFIKAQNPGVIYQGKSQSIKESTDPEVQQTMQKTNDGIKKQKGNPTFENIQQAIKTQRKAMSSWGQRNKNMKPLDALKQLPPKK